VATQIRYQAGPWSVCGTGVADRLIPSRVAPDGKWVVGTLETPGVNPPASKLVRVPIAGGAPEPLFSVSRGPLLSVPDLHLPCARSPSGAQIASK
jgi:hypothetical protein